MNERLRALLAQLKSLWGKWSATQKAILIRNITPIPSWILVCFYQPD